MKLSTFASSLPPDNVRVVTWMHTIGVRYLSHPHIVIVGQKLRETSSSPWVVYYHVVKKRKKSSPWASLGLPIFHHISIGNWVVAPPWLPPLRCCSIGLIDILQCVQQIWQHLGHQMKTLISITGGSKHLNWRYIWGYHGNIVGI